MPLPNAFPLFVDPYLRDCGVAVFEGTVSSGTVTKVGGLCTCGSFSSGVAAVTFPKCKKVIPLSAQEDAGTTTEANANDLVLTDINPEAGTANLRVYDRDDAGDTGNPLDGSFYFSLLLSW